ncbi:hypothetical protein BSKO_07545 [Bryopsis sp. KO-2023]|nr:hypothetical protein BSKO_07545 [Bryopsis sp. KO-2023]
MSVEERVFDLLRQQNKPFSTQLVTDFVAQFGIKKTQVQKTLDSLSEAGKIRVKEFGKTKIYLAVQEGLVVLTKEEKDSQRANLEKQKQESKVNAEALLKLESELNALRTTLTMDEIDAQLTAHKAKIQTLERKVQSLKETATLVTDEEKEKVQKDLDNFLSQWRKRKGVFKEIWSTMSDGLDRKTSEVFEEIGVDTDEACGVSFEELTRLAPKRRRVK